MDNNLEELNGIKNILEQHQNVQDLIEYIDVLIEMEEDSTMGDTCRNGKSWDKCDCC